MTTSSADRTTRTRRVCSLETFQKGVYLVYAALGLGGGGFFLYETVAHPLGLALGLPFALLFGIPGLILALSAFRSRLILDGDRLELRTALRTRMVHRDDIDGLQRIRNDYGKFTRIFLKEHRGVLTVSGAFTGTADLEEWLKGLPDVDECNAAQIEQLIDSQSRAGVGAQTHEALLTKAKRWSIGLTAIAGVACIAAAVPYGPVYFTGMTALAVLAPVAIVVLHRWPLLFTTFKAKVDPRADLVWLLLLSGFGVLLAGMFSSNPTHLVGDPTKSMLGIGLVVFIAFFGAVARIVWRSPARVAGLLLLTICGIAYSVGLVDTADTMPDEPSPSFFRTWIVEKHESQGRRSNTYYLRLAPWGPISHADNVSVPAGTYRRSAVGDPVCLGLHRGFLGTPWFEFLPCSTTRA